MCCPASDNVCNVYNRLGTGPYGTGYPLSNMTLEGGITYDLAPGAVLDAGWLYFSNNATGAAVNSDAVKAGLTYNF